MWIWLATVWTNRDHNINLVTDSYFESKDTVKSWMPMAVH